MEPQVNGLLNIVVGQNATELRLGVGKAPQLFKGSEKKRFTMPETSEEMLRDLLGELFSEEVEARLEAEGEVGFDHALPTGVRFRGRLKRRAGGFEVIFYKRESPKRPDPAPSPPPLSEALVTAEGEHESGAVLASPPALEVSAAGGAPDAAPGVVVGVEEPVVVGHSSGAPVSAGQASSRPAAALSVVAQRRSQRPRLTPRLTQLLSRAVMARASDLHLAPDQLPIVRVDGRLTALIDEPAVDTRVALAGCLVPWVEAALGEGVSADLSLKAPSLGRFRVHLYQAQGGLSAAIRLLPESAPKLDNLKLPADLSELAMLPHGLVIIAGPTGSGKSTTLAALAQHALSRRAAMMVTLEDPIEYRLDAQGRGGLVRQREIGRHVRDYSVGLHDALREDPDIIMVGELREPETIMMALTAAETGHLVLTHLHSRSSASAVERILDACPPERQAQARAQLADSLRAVISQRLLPRSVGRGRLPVMEVMRVNSAIASMIREGRTAQIPSAIQAGAADGMLPLERCLASLVHTGQLRKEDALQVANDAKALRTYLGA